MRYADSERILNDRRLVYDHVGKLWDGIDAYATRTPIVGFWRGTRRIIVHQNESQGRRLGGLLIFHRCGFKKEYDFSFLVSPGFPHCSVWLYRINCPSSHVCQQKHVHFCLHTCSYASICLNFPFHWWALVLLIRKVQSLNLGYPDWCLRYFSQSYAM